MKSKIHQDIFIGIFLILFSSVVYLGAKSLPLGARMMPNICSMLISLLACFVIFNGVQKTQRANMQEPVINSLTWTKLKIPAVTYLYLVGYLLLFYLVGYFIATIVFMIMIMWHLSIKSWKQIILITSSFVLLLYLLVRQFNISVYNLGYFSNYFFIN